MKKASSLFALTGAVALLVSSGSQVFAKGFSTGRSLIETNDLISCGGGGGGGGNSLKKQAEKEAIQEELKKMIEEKKQNKN